MDKKLEKLSSAVSLTVLEIDFYPNELIPAFLLANLMSPALWAWRNEKKAGSDDGILYSPKNRLNQIQRFFHRYTFTNIAGEPGGDPWGLLNFAEEEKRFGSEFVEKIRAEYDATFRKLLAETPESQFGQIINQPYYGEGFFPRLKNETLEVMNAFALVNEEGKRSGKCIGLGMLWAAALVVWGQFPLDRIVITGNRAHMFVFLDEEGGHLLNNTKWFSNTRINNQSELSEFIRVVASSTETTFFYNPEMGMCHCTTRTSQIPQQQITDIYANIGGFVSNPLKHPNPEQIQFVKPDYQIPNPLEYDSAAEFQAAIVALAEQHPDSIYEFALYAFRRLDVNYPQAYIRAAMRDYNIKQLAQGITKLSDALLIVGDIKGQDSIFGSRDRIAMPDETLYFKTGDDRDKSLLLYALLQNSTLADADDLLGLSDEQSFVRHRGEWINVNDLTIQSAEPSELKITFNSHDAVKKSDNPITCVVI
ncbi:MAG: hypothetical protein M3Q33_12245 [Acidobacteriota bacterium]|nr:hypothetical protein [Acidobacteriota bacterium]